MGKLNRDIFLPTKERVCREKVDLDIKISSLTKFIKSAPYQAIDILERNRLSNQLNKMTEYSNILNERILNFK